MERIVVGADGSPGSRNALRWAGNLAAAHNAEVVVMTGFVPVDSELRPGRVETLVAEEERRLATWSEAARVDDVVVRAVVTQGDPRQGILQVAEAEDADLIVVGREGTSAGPGLLHIGSMAEWLAHHADRTVAIVGGAVNTTTRSLMLCLDGSPGSSAATAWAADLAQHAEVEIVAASVDERVADWTASTSPDDWRRVAEDRIRTDWASALTEKGLDFSVLALRGANPADTLLQAARNERTDIIVVGMRGLGGFTELRIGGVALKVLHRADRPVILVPPA